MFRPADPHEAYRRVELDARVAGSRGRDLVELCIHDLEAALGQAIWAHVNERPEICRRALARAQNALGALRLGVDPASPLGPTLLTFYEGLSHSVIACQLRFDPALADGVRRDISEVGRAMLAAA